MAPLRWEGTEVLEEGRGEGERPSSEACPGVEGPGVEGHAAEGRAAEGRGEGGRGVVGLPALGEAWWA